MGSNEEYVQALADVPDQLGGSRLQKVLQGPQGPASITIPSSEGIQTYSGFTNDAKSRKARAWLVARIEATRIRLGQ